MFTKLGQPVRRENGCDRTETREVSQKITQGNKNPSEQEVTRNDARNHAWREIEQRGAMDDE